MRLDELLSHAHKALLGESSYEVATLNAFAETAISVLRQMNDVREGVTSGVYLDACGVIRVLETPSAQTRDVPALWNLAIGVLDIDLFRDAARMTVTDYAEVNHLLAAIGCEILLLTARHNSNYCRAAVLPVGCATYNPFCDILRSTRSSDQWWSSDKPKLTLNDQGKHAVESLTASGLLAKCAAQLAHLEMDDAITHAIAATAPCMPLSHPRRRAPESL